MVLEDVTNTAQPRSRNHHQQQQRVAGGGEATHQPAPTSRIVGAIMAFSFWKTTFRPTQAMEARMTEWADEANADMEFALIPGVRGYSDRFVLCLKKAGPGQITLSRGCETVRAKIGATALPTRLPFGKPFLERLLSKVVQHERRVPEPVWTKGGAFTAAAMRRILSVNNRLLDLENRFEDLVEAGDMTLLDIPTVNHAREIVAREKDELAFASRPELNGKLRLTFWLYDGDGRPAAPDDALPKDGGPTTVEIEGQPGAVGVKGERSQEIQAINTAMNPAAVPATATHAMLKALPPTHRAAVGRLLKDPVYKELASLSCEPNTVVLVEQYIGLFKYMGTAVNQRKVYFKALCKLSDAIVEVWLKNILDTDHHELWRIGVPMSRDKVDTTRLTNGRGVTYIALPLEMLAFIFRFNIHDGTCTKNFEIFMKRKNFVHACIKDNYRYAVRVRLLLNHGFKKVDEGDAGKLLNNKMMPWLEIKRCLTAHKATKRVSSIMDGTNVHVWVVLGNDYPFNVQRKHFDCPTWEWVNRIFRAIVEKIS
ncbi:hypothetical protein CAPTEDRAFT_212314 [Capitella teleta]|uniref:Uncharacterized protein n=1 Tax=Capitella teleta TaxID=283909 RepID=R7V6K9_CAPTE|nr:hypothetical protein CAPTEDRAFT_212314 [Capitella teleta]|eukprot:ELU14513.1 hypothetical protein CAPTEDRAFT_212314 [Capitella teleta]